MYLRYYFQPYFTNLSERIINKNEDISIGAFDDQISIFGSNRKRL
jgi:hypothetical protein